MRLYGDLSFRDIAAGGGWGCFLPLRVTRIGAIESGKYGSIIVPIWDTQSKSVERERDFGFCDFPPSWNDIVCVQCLGAGRLLNHSHMCLRNVDRTLLKSLSDQIPSHMPWESINAWAQKFGDPGSLRALFVHLIMAGNSERWMSIVEQKSNLAGKIWEAVGHSAPIRYVVQKMQEEELKTSRLTFLQSGVTEDNDFVLSNPGQNWTIVVE